MTSKPCERPRGAKKVSLWGISYGTHLALATIRRHGSKIDRAILAGVEGPDDTYKLPSAAQLQLAEIDRRIRTDPLLNKLIPDFIALVRSLLERLEERPLMVEVTDPRTQQKLKVGIGRLDLQFLTAQALGDSSAIKALPLLYYAMSKGDFSVVARQLAVFRKSPIGSAMSFAMDCASGASAERLVRIRREETDFLLGAVANAPFPEICEPFGNPDVGAAFRAPIKSSIPVLFISGSLDGQTPVANAEAVGKAFRRSIQLIIDGAGHGDDLFLSSSKIKDIMSAFMRRESMPSRMNIETVPPFEFRKP